MSLHSKKIKWGIIGLGNIAQKFAKDLATISDAELYAVASRSQEKSDKFADEFNATIAYDTYEALAKDKNVDAVYIATPHSFHKEHTILCLMNNKAVLCEKPFAMNIKEVQEMMTVAKKQNVLLMEAMWTYFLPHYQYVLELIKNKTLGEVISLEADFGFNKPFDAEDRLFKKEVGGGSLLDIGIYPIFAALTTLGTPDKIEAQATFFENGVDASCDIVFQYQNAKAFLKSAIQEQTATQAIFTCEQGIIKINTEFHIPTSVTIIKNGKEEIIDFGVKTIGYNYETEHFNQLLREGKKESNIMTFDFSKKLIETLDIVREKIGLEY
ncbi:Gfo/Idh/MocA family protein [Wenyingzhuangia marina]|uniref:Predicted dehydrogenase n=1 Tax=Wenyingzhuangia marina TaxID=1195760 RepID=A0A1M5UG99_9FLAO|nr:Gfo/Idh/MocA family oxidoreductase [Wenyingzhuangia marina]GGF68021.1 dehydrogenase [Wenyingzhuangia marina]SHH61663.1 Predicted dehydrogenase [Wenyingzhuangia marina]